jgi:hypothetical protein
VNLQETNQLLRFAASVDNRKFDDATVVAWQAILADVDSVDAMAAAVEHFRTNRDYLVPVHIRDGAKAVVELREREILREQVQNRLAKLDDHTESAPQMVTSGEDRAPEVRALIQSVTDSLPKVDNHARAVARARAERGRPTPAPVRKRKQHTTPMKYPKPADASIAALATRYLIDGYQPSAVSSMLGISNRWCEKTAARFASQP